MRRAVDDLFLAWVVAMFVYNALVPTPGLAAVYAACITLNVITRGRVRS